MRWLRRGNWQEQEWRAGWEPGVGELPPADAPAIAGPPADAGPLAGPVAEPTVVAVPVVEPAGPAAATGPGFDLPPERTSYARAWSQTRAEPDDARGMVVHFRRAAVALALGADEGRPPAEAARECAGALVGLASADREDLLAPVLRPDPEGGDVTWTVACYQIGDLSPSTLRDFGDASSAVRTLAGCGEAAHVAAELIVTNGDGVRWTALVRSGADLTFQLLEAATASAPSPAALVGVRHAWEDQLMDWAARPTAGLDTPATGPRPAVEAAAPGPVSGTGEGMAMGMALGQILESIRRIETRLPSGSGAPAAPVPDAAVDLGRQVERLEREVEQLRRDLSSSTRRLAALEAALEAGDDHPVATPGLGAAGGAPALSLARPERDRVTWLR